MEHKVMNKLKSYKATTMFEDIFLKSDFLKHCANSDPFKIINIWNQLYLHVDKPSMIYHRSKTCIKQMHK